MIEGNIADVDADLAVRLEEGDEPIIRIAESVGYQSERAFNKAFSKEMGIAVARVVRDAEAVDRVCAAGAGLRALHAVGERSSLREADA